MKLELVERGAAEKMREAWREIYCEYPISRALSNKAYIKSVIAGGGRKFP